MVTNKRMGEKQHPWRWRCIQSGCKTFLLVKYLWRYSTRSYIFRTMWQWIMSKVFLSRWSWCTKGSSSLCTVLRCFSVQRSDQCSVFWNPACSCVSFLPLAILILPRNILQNSLLGMHRSVIPCQLPVVTQLKVAFHREFYYLSFSPVCWASQIIQIISNRSVRSSCTSR